MRKVANMPKFGQRFINTMAGEKNPHRTATFVRVVRRHGKLNPGTWWEMTDERGDFWLGNPDTMSPVEERCDSCGGLGVTFPLGRAFGENPPCESCGGKGRHLP